MENTRNIFVPFAKYEFEYVESFLTDKASEGWFLESFTSKTANMKKGEPENGRYRLMPAKGQMLQEEKEIYEAAGWKYICKFNRFDVFYTSDDEAEELFTDRDSFRTCIKKFMNRYMIVVIALLALVILYYLLAVIGLITLDNQDRTGMLHNLDYSGFLACLGVFMLPIVASVFAVLEFVRVIRKKRDINKGRSMQHDIPYKRRLTLNRIELLILAVAIILNLAVPFTSTKVSYDEPVIKDMAHPVSFEQIDKDTYEKIKNLPEIEYMYEGTDEYWQEEESNLVFKRSIREKAWTEEIGYDATFYEARTEGMAARYLDEAFRYSEEGSFEPEKQRIDVPGVEWAGMYEADFQGRHEQHLWLKQGNRLEQIIYFGDKDVLDYIDLFVEDINEE